MDDECSGAERITTYPAHRASRKEMKKVRAGGCGERETATGHLEYRE